jgi:ribosomal protein S27AE
VALSRGSLSCPRCGRASPGARHRSRVR